MVMYDRHPLLVICEGYSGVGRQCKLNAKPRQRSPLRSPFESPFESPLRSPL